MGLLTLVPVFAGPEADWYENAVALTETDYFAGVGESAGWWVGDPEHPDYPDELFGDRASQAARVLVGATPRPRPVPGRRWGGSSGWGFGAAAYDFTFYAPKSVSLMHKSLYARARFAAAHRIEAAFDAAWGEALEWFDIEESLAVGYLPDGTVGLVEHDGLAGVAYPHRMDRSGNPHLHTHIVISRHVMRDGARLHIDIRHLPDFVPQMEARYRARLRVELEEAGWELRPLGEPDQDELADVDPKTIRKWAGRGGPCRWAPPERRRFSLFSKQP